MAWLSEAFNQIKRCYQRDGFWAACGLYEYVQIFVISNEHTKYYSNTTRISHVQEMAGEVKDGRVKKPVTALNLPRFGQMAITKQLLILWILQKRFYQNIQF